MKKFIDRKIKHSFNKNNLKIALKSFLHSIAAIGLCQIIPPHSWQISFSCGLIYGAIMHFLFHYRDDNNIIDK